MAKNKIIAGIDLGSSKVATIIANISQDAVSFEKTINIIGVSSVVSRGVRKGQIVDIEEAVEAIIESVEGAERMAGYNLDKAYVSVGGSNIGSVNSHGVVAVSNPESEITVEDVDRVVEAASAISMPSSREIVHVLPREFVVDGESGVKDPVGMSGVRLEVETHMVTAASSSIKNLKKAVNEVGVGIEEVVFTGLAASNCVLTDTEKELGCVLIDVGGGTTSIACFIEGALAFSSILPIGAKNVTNDLAIGLRVALESAEKIKLALSAEKVKVKKHKESGSEEDEFDLSGLGVDETRKISRKTLTEGIIRPRLNEIFTMVRAALDKEGLAARVPSGVILTGGGAETIGIVDSAKRVLALPVRIGVPRDITGLIDEIMTPSFASAVGLVTYAMKGGKDLEMSSSSSRLKLPKLGLLTKVVQNVRDLLP